jgi:hypothetical protein
MASSVEIRCFDPLRRDALEEAARLALSFVAVASRPQFTLNWRQGALQLTLTSTALRDGCYLPETAQQLLEAAQSFGVKVMRKERPGDETPSEEWASWWSALPLCPESTDFELVLEIL